MSSKSSFAKIPPLFFGRTTRVLFGLGTFLVVAYVGLEDLGLVGASLLGILGLSFIIGGIMGNPGCELTALPNLLLPRSRRMHCT